MSDFISNFWHLYVAGITLVSILACLLLLWFSGKAKAMIVTSSRLHAVRYKLAVDACLKKEGSPFRALVAFTDVVKDPRDGKEYTEGGMNGFPDTATGDRFEGDEYRFLIVASKFQTGFDQPKLLAMYVDKKLAGVACVQTLSRLNRTMAGKEETFVLDFENTADDIEKSFQPFYDRITLSKETDPNQLYNIRTDLDKFSIHSAADLDSFAGEWFASKPKIAKLHALTNPVADRWAKAAEEDRIDSKARDFVKLYAFIAQLVPLRDTGLEKLSVFLRFLLPKLLSKKSETPMEIVSMVDMEKLAVRRRDTTNIGLKRGEKKVDPLNYGGGAAISEEEREQLSKIIDDLNTRFNTSFNDDEVMVIKQLEKKIGEDEALQQQLRNGSRHAVRATFQQVAKDAFEDLVNDNFKFYKKVSSDDEVSEEFFARLFEWYIGSRSREEKRRK